MDARILIGVDPGTRNFGLVTVSSFSRKTLTTTTTTTDTCSCSSVVEQQHNPLKHNLFPDSLEILDARCVDLGGKRANTYRLAKGVVSALEKTYSSAMYTRYSSVTVAVEKQCRGLNNKIVEAAVITWAISKGFMPICCNPSEVKKHFGISLLGHYLNKKNAVEKVKDIIHALDLKVPMSCVGGKMNDHISDAFLCALYANDVLYD